MMWYGWHIKHIYYLVYITFFPYLGYYEYNQLAINQQCLAKGKISSILGLITIIYLLHDNYSTFTIKCKYSLIIIDA